MTDLRHSHEFWRVLRTLTVRPGRLVGFYQCGTPEAPVVHMLVWNADLREEFAANTVMNIPPDEMRTCNCEAHGPLYAYRLLEDGEDLPTGAPMP